MYIYEVKFVKTFIFLPTVNSLIKGINWFGFETEYKNLMCTWTNDINGI